MYFYCDKYVIKLLVLEYKKVILSVLVKNVCILVVIILMWIKVLESIFLIYLNYI